MLPCKSLAGFSRGKPSCISTTRSIRGWWTSGSPSSATRPGASWPASSRRTISGRCGCATASTSSATRPMLRVAIPYGLLSIAPVAHARAHRPHVGPRLRPFQHAPEHPVQLAEAGGRARHPGRARHGADARDPDQRQSLPQHHHRPLRRRRARRDRGFLRLVRAAAPVVHVPPGVLLPAAQVQDRGERRDSRSRGDLPARHRAAGGARRRRRDRLPRDRRRRHGAHAHHRPRDPRIPAVAAPAHLPRGDPARLQPLRPARQHPQGAHQDPGEGAHAGGVPRGGRSGMGASEGRPGHADRGGSRARRSALHAAAATSGSPGDDRRHARAARRRAGVCRLGEAQRPSPQGAGLRGGDAVAQEDRRAAGRRHRRPDGRGGGSRRSLQPGRAAGFPRAEPDPRRRAPVGPARAVGAKRRRSGWRRPTSG